jgi:predicted dinucleotide-binding enzyme
MNIGILGSGLMGAKLGTLWARAGHDVVFSYAHTKGKLDKLARDAGKNASAGTLGEAVQASDVLMLAVNWPRLDDVLKQAGDLSGKVVITCSLPMNASNTEFVIAHTNSGAEELAKRLPKARVVSAFNTIPSEVLFGTYEKKRNATKPSLLYCGDDAKSKKIAATLISELGFEPLDLGDLRMARYTEPMAMIVGELAYNGSKGPEMSYRFEWLGK